MGNKMKKLICSLLTAAMLVTSAGVVSFADETTTEANSEVTVTETADDSSTADQTDEEKEATDADTTATDASETTAEATEAPAAEATEAPAAETTASAPVTSTTSSGKNYDNDSYYQKSLALCSSLGIISGYEDGSVRPDSNVTRAEMASIVLRMLALSSNATYQNVFTDVSSTHWAADQIQTAYEAGVINGMGDGTFVPDGDVTYVQVIVMLVNAMNYQQDAEYYGGYPDGYIKVAGDSALNLLKNAPGVSDVAADRGTVIKMVYNALLGEYKQIRTYENGAPKYEVNADHPSLAYAKFNVIDKEGVLYGTAKTTIGTTDLQDGQIEILPKDEDTAEVFDTVLTGLEDYIAQKITYYYREIGGRTAEVVAVADSAKSETYTIDDVDDIEYMTGFDTGNGKIKVEGVNKEKDCEGATIIYNGKVITNKLYEAEKAKATGDNAKRFKDDFNAFITPEVGSVRLVNSNKTGDKYDVVFIDSYDTIVVTSASNEKLNGKISSPAENASTAKEISETAAYSINLDDTEDRTVTVTKGGEEARLRNLKKNDVASVKRSLDDTVVDVAVSGESITGSAGSVSIKLDDSHATVNGTRYEVANIAVGDLKAGSQSTFYFDTFGRIAYIESSGGSLLQSGEKYGWIMNAYTAENQEDFMVQIMTAEGKAQEYVVDDTVDYWAPDATASTTLSKATVNTTLTNLMSGNSFIKASSINSPIRLVKYKTNSSNVITRLYVAVDSTKVTDEAAMRVNPTNLNGKASVGGAVAGYTISDGITEFQVPKDIADMKDADNYKVGTATASVYVVREDGAKKDYVVGEFDSSSPQIIVQFTASATAAAAMTDMDSAGSGPSAMVVKKNGIDSGINDDEDTIYTINGYIGTAEVSVTTNKNTNLGVLTKSLWTSSNNGRNFDAPTVWDGTGKYDSTSVAEYLDQGDLILYTSDGKLIAKFSDAEDLAEYVLNGVAYNHPMGSMPNRSGSRVGYFFSALEDYDSDTAWIELKGVTDRVVFDPTKAMDLITITKKAQADGTYTYTIDVDPDGCDVADLEAFDEATLTGDYVYVSTANKGDINNIVVYKFK